MALTAEHEELMAIERELGRYGQAMTDSEFEYAVHRRDELKEIVAGQDKKRGTYERYKREVQRDIATS